jgi:hypothetical protein
VPAAVDDLVAFRAAVVVVEAGGARLAVCARVPGEAPAASGVTQPARRPPAVGVGGACGEGTVDVATRTGPAVEAGAGSVWRTAAVGAAVCELVAGCAAAVAEQVLLAHWSVGDIAGGRRPPVKAHARPCGSRASSVAAAVFYFVAFGTAVAAKLVLLTGFPDGNIARRRFPPFKAHAQAVDSGASSMTAAIHGFVAAQGAFRTVYIKFAWFTSNTAKASEAFTRSIHTIPLG